jgi:hypothetical protein
VVRDAAVRSRVERFVENELGVYSSHPRFGRRRIRAWIGVASIPLGLAVCFVLAKLCSHDVIEHFTKGTLVTEGMRWFMWIVGAVWFLFGAALTVLLCLYMSRFEGASASRREVAPGFFLAVGTGLVASIAPVLLYVYVSEWMDGLFGDESGVQGLRFKVYAAVLSLLPVLVLILGLELFGKRNVRSIGRESRFRGAWSALSWLFALSGLLLFIPSVGDWLVRNSPESLVDLVPRPSDIPGLEKTSGLELGSFLERPKDFTDAQWQSLRYLTGVQRRLLQLLVFGVFLLLVTAAVIVVRFLKGDLDVEEIPTALERREGAKDHGLGPPLPLAVPGFCAQPRGLGRFVHRESGTLVGDDGSDGDQVVGVSGAAATAPGHEVGATKAGDRPPTLLAGGDMLGKIKEFVGAYSRSGDESGSSGPSGVEDGVIDGGPKASNLTERSDGAVVASSSSESASDSRSGKISPPKTMLSIAKLIAEAEAGAADAEAADESDLEDRVERFLRLGPGCTRLESYSGSEFGGVMPSLDQVLALQMFERLWVEAQRRSASSATGSIEHAAELSSSDLIVEGDPGTGRTTSLLAMAFHAIALRGQSVLLIAPADASAEAVERRAKEIFQLSAAGPFVTVERLGRKRIEELVRLSDIRDSGGIEEHSTGIEGGADGVSIPDLAIMTPRDYEEGFFGAVGSARGIRALLHRYQVVLIDDILELDAFSRMHLPFILDKHRLILKLDGYGCQTVVAGRRPCEATRRLLEKRLFTAVGKVQSVALRSWDDRLSWLLRRPASEADGAMVTDVTRALLAAGCDVAVFRPGITDARVRVETNRLAKGGRGPRVVSSLASLNRSAAEFEVKTTGIPGSNDCPVADPTVWQLAADASALVMAIDRDTRTRMFIRFGSRVASRQPTVMPLLASSHSRSIAWSHLSSACRLVRPWSPSNRNYWAKLGLGDAEDYSRLGFQRVGEEYEALRRLEVDPMIDDPAFRNEQAVWNWVVLEPVRALEAGMGGASTEDLPPQPADFALERLHGFELIPDADRRTLWIKRRIVEEDFISTWVTDQGLAAGKRDLSYAPHLRFGLEGVDVAQGGAVFAAKLSRVLLEGDPRHREEHGGPRANIRVECLPYSSPTLDPYIPWWGITVGFRGRRMPHDRVAPIAIEPVTRAWPEVLWANVRESTSPSTRIRRSQDDGARHHARIRIERLLSRAGQINPVSPAVEFEYEASISVMLIAQPGQAPEIRRLGGRLEDDVGELLHGIWESSVTAETADEPMRVEADLHQRADGGAAQAMPSGRGPKAREMLSVPVSHAWTAANRDFQVRWSLDRRLAEERVSRFGVTEELRAYSDAAKEVPGFERASLEERAAIRGLLVSLVKAKQDGADKFQFSPDFARLVMQGASDLRELASQILDRAAVSGVESDHELVEIVIAFVVTRVSIEPAGSAGGEASPDPDGVDRLGLSPAIATLLRQRGGIDSVTVLVAALLHACGVCRIVGLETDPGEVEVCGRFLLGLELPPGAGEQTLHVGGVDALLVTFEDGAWSLGEIPSGFEGRPFRAIHLDDGDDLASYRLESERDCESAGLVREESLGRRRPSPRLTALSMIALRRHVPDAEKFCRTSAFRLHDERWMAAILFIEPAPTRFSVADVLREMLRDAQAAADFFRTMVAASDSELDQDRFDPSQPSLAIQAEQRVGPEMDAFTIEELRGRLNDVVAHLEPGVVQ